MDLRYKEVYFSEYCSKCKYNNTEESKDPCNKCLSYSYNEHSHKPINYEGVGVDDKKRNKSV